MSKIQTLTLDGVLENKEFIESLPVIFPNLKRLKTYSRQSESEWVACKFPKLERFSFSFGAPVPIV